MAYIIVVGSLSGIIMVHILGYWANIWVVNMPGDACLMLHLEHYINTYTVIYSNDGYIYHIWKFQIHLHVQYIHFYIAWVG